MKRVLIVASLALAAAAGAAVTWFCWAIEAISRAEEAMDS